MTYRNLILPVLFLCLSLSGFAQSPVFGTDASARSRPPYAGQYMGIYDSQQLFFLDKNGTLLPQKVTQDNVVGLSAKFAGYYNAGKIDSLTNLKADASNVYTKSAANGLFKPLSYAPAWNEITGKLSVYPSNIANVSGLQDSLSAKLTRAEYIQFASEIDSAAYKKSESLALFAQKATSLSGYNISNAFTKTEIDNKLPYASAKDLAAIGGYVLSTVSTDDNRTALQYAVNNPGPSNGVRIPAGIYYVSGPIDIYGGRQIVFDFGAQLRVMNNFATDPIAGNDGRYVLRVRAANVKIENASIDCMGLAAAPIALYFADDVTVTGCTIRNWRIGNLGQHGIAVLASKRARILNNTLINGEHGINVYASDGTIVQGNFVDMMVHGGIYNVFTSNFTAIANTVSNCGDVGLDSEGGAFNLWTANTVTRCKNGELAIFSGANAETYVSHHLIFRGNTVHREGVYTTMNATGTTSTTATCAPQYGACSIFSLDEGCYESGFENNTITNTFGWVFWHNVIGDKSNRRIFFRNNQVTTSTGIFDTKDSDGLSITGNDITAMPGSEAIENIIRDAHNGLFARNTIRYINTKTTNYATRFLTVSAFATVPFRIEQNTIINAETRAMQVDLYENAGLNPTVWANRLGDTYTTNGGLDISANGKVRLVDQHLKLSLAAGTGGNDFKQLPALKQMTGIGRASGNLSFGRAGYNGLFGNLNLIVKGDGNVDAFTSTLNPDANWSLTGTATTGIVTFTTSVSGTFTGNADITVNSY